MTVHADRGRSVVALAFTALLLLSGCSTPNVEGFRDVRALIDQDSGTITLPLDAYALNARQQVVIEHANALLVAQCMEEQNLPYPRADEEWDNLRPFPERRFGLWLRNQAEISGYDVPLDEGTKQIDALEQSYPDEWWEAAFVCLDITEQMPLMGTEVNGETISVAARGTLEASDAAMRDPAWAEALEPWASCLAERGIATYDAVTAVPQLPDDLEAQARIALIDVECKESNGTIQALADVMSQHQAVYVAQHENELNAYKSEGLEVFEKAIDVIERLG